MTDWENPLAILENCFKKLGFGVKIYGRWGNLKHTTFYFRPDPSSPAKVSSYLPFDKPFASQPSKFINSAD